MKLLLLFQTVYEIYWSKPQMRARQHPNMFAVQKALLGLWHKSEDKEVEVDLEKPVMYIDRLRIRPPGGWTTHMRPQSFISYRNMKGLKPHITICLPT